MTTAIVRADARHLPLPDASVDLIVTSPPYFALRDYRDGDGSLAGQIGAEDSPREYVAALLECTREWMRVLKPCGSIFVNLGDTYGRGTRSREARAQALHDRRGRGIDRGLLGDNLPAGTPAKSLIGLPWRYALGCIDDLGLILRAEIIWSKANGMPESVTDRVRRSHEQFFHFTLQPRYYSAVDEIRQAYEAPNAIRTNGRSIHSGIRKGGDYAALSRDAADSMNPLGKLPGSVWEVATQPLKVPAHLAVEHFAAFPPALIRRIILGWSPPGICTVCGEGRRPVVASVGLDMSRPQARRAHALAERAQLTEEHLAALLSVGVSDTGRGAATQTGTGKNRPEVYVLADEARKVLGGYAREYLLRRPTGFIYACACPTPDAPTRPALVVDPFGGTGTSAVVSSVHGRHGISFDLSADYCRLAAWRTTDPGERARAFGVPKPPPVITGQGDLFEEPA